MKRVHIAVLAAALAISSLSSALAGGADNKLNWSAEYIRTLNRNGATDSADIVVYNPAGTVKMKNGAYLNLGVQDVLKTYTNTVAGTDYESDTPSYVPGLFGLYKQGDWAAFASLTVVGGGGKVEYDNGNASTIAAGTALGGVTGNMSLHAESRYLGYTFGGAYRFNDRISASAGVRYVHAKKEAQAAVTALAGTALVDYEYDADGWGAVIGLDIAPTDKLNIGMRFESKTKLDFEYTVRGNVLGQAVLAGQTPPIINGSRIRRDLPGLFAIGVSHQYTPRIRIETDLTYYLNANADWNNTEENIDNGYDVGLAVTTALSDKLNGSLGYLHTETGIDDVQFTIPEAPVLDANTYGAGLEYHYSPAMKMDFSVGKVYYQDAVPGNAPTVTYKKDVVFLAVGLQYKFL
jgi:long-chain fatty acid transport protein